MNRIWKVLTRKKIIDPVSVEETRLNRVLNTFDLTALGVGSTLGVGVYVLAGQVAKDTAGPAVILSFLIAAIASVFAGLCYAEFGARAPRAGSAYIYSYVCIGEFIAFVIGWNLILEYVIGSASVAKGLSLYLDTLLNNTLEDTFIEIAPINAPYLAKYFDFFSFGISILLAVALAFGMKESSIINNIITSLNIGVIIFIIIAGSIKANSKNWHISPPNNTNSTDHIGRGGFFPFGIEGVIKGAATCFYGFVGFDCIATTGEEVKNPRKAIPIAIIVSLLIIFLAYFGTSTVLTLMVPYYLQDHSAPIPKAFESIGWEWAKWIVAIGALLGLCASLFGAMFPLPRIIYAMGSDGLIFRFLAKVHSRFQTPVIGTVVAGVMTGLMSALFDLRQLINMMSIGTLLAYTIVAASVLLLRYKEEVKKLYIPVKNTSSDTDSTSSESSDGDKYNDDTIRRNFYGSSNIDSDNQELITSELTSKWKLILYIFNCRSKEPNRITESIVAIEVFLYCIFCVCIGLCAIYLKTAILNKETWAIAVVSVVIGLTVLIVVSIATQPRSRQELSFKVPFVPVVPAISILINIYLMLMLDYRTWIRFGVWMILGIPMYCACALKRETNDEQQSHNYSTNITNGTSVMQNSTNEKDNGTVLIQNGGNQKQSNATFANNVTKRKQVAPLPPTPPSSSAQSVPIDTKDNNNNNIEKLQEEAILAQLDQILDKVESDSVAVDEIDFCLRRDNSLSSNNDSFGVVQLGNGCNPIVLPSTVNSSLCSFENVSDEEIGSIHSLALNKEKLTESEAKGCAEKLIEKPEQNHTNTIQSLDISSGNQAGNSSAMPTEEALKTVRLRHIDTKNIVNSPTKQRSEKNYLASSSNLKVGTEEYKEFRQLLDKRLKATYEPFQRTSINTAKQINPIHNEQPSTNHQKPIIVNHGVVDFESIDLVQAKLKLGEFLNKRNRSNSVNSGKTTTDSTAGIEKSKSFRQPQQQWFDHKNKMENVLKSIETLRTHVVVD